MIKIFSNYSLTELEKEINGWLKEHPVEVTIARSNVYEDRYVLIIFYHERN